MSSSVWKPPGEGHQLRRQPQPQPRGFGAADVPGQHRPEGNVPVRPDADPGFRPRGRQDEPDFAGRPSDRWVSSERPPLNQSKLRRALLEPFGAYNRVDVVESVGSTNAELLREAEANGLPDMAVLAADYQYAGRGRLNRTWQAPACTAISASIFVQPGPLVPLSTWPWVPLLSGLAIAQALQRVAGINAGVKWPNDVLVDFAGAQPGKVCGILAETVGTKDGPGIVVGFGVNVLQERGELPVPEATSLALSHAVVTDRDAILTACLRSFASVYKQWRDAAGSPTLSGIADDVRNVCLTLGQRVSVELPGVDEPVIGYAEDLADDGRLIVHTPAGGILHVGSGDVQHVRTLHD